MEILQTIALTSVAWIVTVSVLMYLLYTEKIPGEEGNMAFYFMLQAAVPVAVFWYISHQ